MAMKRLYFRGKLLNQRTIDMVKRLEFNLLRRLDITQGSYNGGGVSASAGTHDGGGAADFWTSGMSEAEKKRVLEEARKVGFAMWLRRKIPGLWNEHLHTIAIDDPELSRGARNQVSAYRNKRNGLNDNGRDDGPWVGVFVWPVKPTVKVNAWALRKQFKATKPTYDINVKRAQWVLNDKLGLNLTTDGVAGPKSKAAWISWEKKCKAVTPNSVPNLRTIKMLGDGYFNTGLVAWNKYFASSNKK